MREPLHGQGSSQPRYTELAAQRNAARAEAKHLRVALARLHAACVGYQRSSSDLMFEELQAAIAEARRILESDFR